jgi:anti-sigma regulatory factor (Ser/Thr protein kinase)
VTANQNGWVVLYRSPDFSSGNIVGYAPVYRGTNNNVLAAVDSTRAKDHPTLWAQLHADAGIQNVFEWGNTERLSDGTFAKVFNDNPVTQNNSYIRASFATTPSPATTPSSAAAPSTSTKKSTNQITAGNQSLNTGVIVLDAVTADQDGWVVIYRDPGFKTSDIVGYAPVYKGTNDGVKVTVDTAKLTDQQPELWAMLHEDQGMSNVFEWGNTERLSDGTFAKVFNDNPMTQNNSYIRASFATTPAPAASPSASTKKSTNQITAGNQSLNTGVVVLDSVTADQDGWVVIYRDPGFKTSDIVGYAPVYKGTNDGVKVTVDTARLTDQQPMLWAMLHSDQGMSNVFEWGYKGRAHADPPVFPNVTAGFGTSGP